MTVEEFIDAADARGWHFTASWMRKKFRQLKETP